MGVKTPLVGHHSAEIISLKVLGCRAQEDLSRHLRWAGGLDSRPPNPGSCEQSLM